MEFIFFFSSCFIFIIYFLGGLRGFAWIPARTNILSLHTIVCLIACLFLYGFQPPNLHQYFSYVCSSYLWNNFQPKASTWMYLRKTFTVLVDYSHNLDPFQMICIKFQTHNLSMYHCVIKVLKFLASFLRN